MPLNREMRDVILQHAELLQEDEIPVVLLDPCSHVATYETLVERWRTGISTGGVLPINVSVIPFPAERLSEYVEGRYRALKRTQVKLLRGLRVAPEDGTG